VVVRDVTERYRRFEAERRSAESLARQQDAQAINRFTRHEVKNGLLAGIELCDSLHEFVEIADTGCGGQWTVKTKHW
jgi:phage terminase small subunit